MRIELMRNRQLSLSAHSVSIIALCKTQALAQALRYVVVRKGIHVAGFIKLTQAHC